MPIMDFPANPSVGDKYTNEVGVVYIWNGYAWDVGFYDTENQTFTVVGDLLDQIRTLLLDVDATSGQYRYSTDSIIANLNLGLLEMFRLRPDIFLGNLFVVPQFNSAQLDADVVIEQQYVPPLIYYTVGMTQARDDEETQDARAGAFLQTFQRQLLAVAGPVTPGAAP